MPDGIRVLEFAFGGETRFVGVFSSAERAVEAAGRTARRWLHRFAAGQDDRARGARALLDRGDLALRPCAPRRAGEAELLDIVGAAGEILVLDAFAIRRCVVDGDTVVHDSAGRPDGPEPPVPLLAPDPGGHEELRARLRAAPNLVDMATTIQARRRAAERLVERLPPDVKARLSDESPESPDVENPGVHAAPWTVEWYPDEIQVRDANLNLVCRTAAVPAGGPIPDGVREEWLLPLFRRIRMLPELGGGLRAFLEDPTEARAQALRRLSREYEAPPARDDEARWSG